MGVGDSLVGFAVYVAAFVLVLLGAAVLERLLPAPSRNQFESGPAELGVELTEFKSAS